MLDLFSETVKKISPHKKQEGCIASVKTNCFFKQCVSSEQPLVTELSSANSPTSSTDASSEMLLKNHQYKLSDHDLLIPKTFETISAENHLPSNQPNYSDDFNSLEREVEILFSPASECYQPCTFECGNTTKILSKHSNKHDDEISSEFTFDSAPKVKQKSPQSSSGKLQDTLVCSCTIL